MQGHTYSSSWNYWNWYFISCWLKKCWELILVSLTFCKLLRCRRALCIFASFLIKMTSTLQSAWSGCQHFLGNISIPLLFCNKRFDQKLPDTNALADFSMFGLTSLFLYQSHVNGAKHGSDFSIVGNYITFDPCKLFITMTVIIVHTILEGKRYNICFP